MSFVTADVCDANAVRLASGDIRVLQPEVLKGYGGRKVFSGQVVTMKVFEDNVAIRKTLETEGKGRVLVVDGGASMRCALVGDTIGKIAMKNGWSGIVINGCIRDVDNLSLVDIGVLALAAHPGRPKKTGLVEKNVAVHIAGTVICDGDWLYVDSDGILVSKTQLPPLDL